MPLAERITMMMLMMMVWGSILKFPVCETTYDTVVVRRRMCYDVEINYDTFEDLQSTRLNLETLTHIRNHTESTEWRTHNTTYNIQCGSEREWREM